MKYVAIKPLNQAEAEAMLASSDSEEVVYGLLGAVEGDADWQWVEAQCLSFLDDPREAVARVAIMSLGHLARLNRALNLDRVLPALRQRSTGYSPAIKGVVEDALSDIEIYCK